MRVRHEGQPLQGKFDSVQRLMSRLGGYGTSIGDWFVPDSIRGRGIEAVRRARLVVGVSLSGVALLLIGSMNAYLDGAAAEAQWPLLIASLLSAIPLVLRFTGATNLAANLVVAAIAFTIGFGNFARFAGGHTPLIATAMVPMVAVLLGGWRVGLVWGGLSVIQILLLAGAHAGELQLPALLVPSEAVVQGTSRMRATGVMIVILVIALVYDALKTRSLREAAAARDRAENADRTKTEFVASLSHEVRTPISVIIGISDMLFDSDLTDEQKDLVRTLNRTGHNLLGLVNDVLDLSKIEAGRLEIESIPMDVVSIARDVRRQLGPAAATKGIEFDLKLGRNLPRRVYGDPARLRQVLLNLVGNAIKFTSDGGVELEVVPGKVRGDDVTLRFAVSDTGTGIPADQLPRLFERYTQIDASTARVAGGSGLGLPISQELVSRMKGKLQATSQPGLGSRFSFSLPTRIAPPPRAKSPDVALAGAPEPLPVENESRAKQIAAS